MEWMVGLEDSYNARGNGVSPEMDGCISESENKMNVGQKG